MSKSRKTLATVLEIVSYETDVEITQIMSRRSDAETVDARWICVRLLRELGYYPSKIAEMMRISPRYAQYIITDFDDRILLNTLMRRNYETARKRLRNNPEETT